MNTTANYGRIISPAVIRGLAVAAALTAGLALGTGSAAAADPTVLSPSHLLSAGADAMDRGNIAQGMRLTRQAMGQVLSARNRSAAMNNLCVGYYTQSKFGKALDYCHKAVEADGKNWRAYNGRANIHFAIGTLEEAVKDYRRALSLRPDSTAVNHNLALALTELGTRKVSALTSDD